MKVVNDRMQQEANAKLQKEKELSRVKISKEDVDLIVSSIEALVCLKLFCLMWCYVSLHRTYLDITIIHINTYIELSHS